MIPKEKLVTYIRTQAFALNLLADQIEQGQPVTAGWMIEYDMSQFRKEIETMEGQEQLNNEHEQIGKEVA